jgi:hypothetical protein
MLIKIMLTKIMLTKIMLAKILLTKNMASRIKTLIIKISHQTILEKQPIETKLHIISLRL